MTEEKAGVVQTPVVSVTFAMVLPKCTAVVHVWVHEPNEDRPVLDARCECGLLRWGGPHD